MTTLRIEEANFKEFIERVRAGEQFTLTYNETPLANVIPIPSRDPEKIRKSIEEMRRLSEGQSLDGLKIKDLMNEGRK